MLPTGGAGRVAGGNVWGAALHLEGSGLYFVHGSWEETDETCNRGFAVEMCCCVLKQLSVCFPCLGDVKLSLPLTPSISNVFMA